MKNEMNKNIYPNNRGVQGGLNKNQILETFGISSSTFYRRRTSFFHPELSGYTANTSDNKLVFDGRICEEVFILQRTPKDLNKLTKHIKFLTWNYFANITPKDADESTNEHLIQLVFEILKKLDKKIKLYYSIEPSYDSKSKINSFHTHFLVQTSVDITKDQIWSQIKKNELLMEFLTPQSKSNTTFWWKIYNYRDFEKLGIQYTQKMGENFKLLG
jgi:hypothetical protein